jgi:hypothetical protein
MPNTLCSSNLSSLLILTVYGTIFAQNIVGMCDSSLSGCGFIEFSLYQSLVDGSIVRSLDVQICHQRSAETKDLGFLETTMRR